MLALEEKARTVVLLHSELVEAEKHQAIFKHFQDNYLDVKAHKEVYLTREDAANFFHYEEPDERQAKVEMHCKGLTEVVVLENLDGNVVERTLELMETLKTEYGEIYCSRGAWEAARDLEFFFPHLDQLPVERTLALIKADGLSKSAPDGKTLEDLVEAEAAAVDLVVVGKRRMVLKPQQAEALCQFPEGTPDRQQEMALLLAEPGVVAICLEGRGAIGKWNLLCGPVNSGVARAHAPTTLRARFGTDSTNNAVHGSETMEGAEKELGTLFPSGVLQLQRTLCIVKPDAMPSLLQIRQCIQDWNFTVLVEKQTVISEERAKEFYRDYKDKPFFNSLVRHASSGPCCILVLCRLEAVSVWQQLMGPEVVKDARRTRPKSLRARFGRDGQRNAVHGSDSFKKAGREVRFFFPELGSDPVPDDDEVRDFLFRKSAGASMDLKSLSDAESINLSNVDPTLQQLLSRGLMALCQVQPKGLNAVKWLSRWLQENNPNLMPKEAGTTGHVFMPADRTKRFIEHGVNQDGLPFAVEAPPPQKKKQVVEVDVTEETEEMRMSDLQTPPFVVFVAGGPGSGKGTQCAKIREEFNLVHLSTGDLMREEVAAQTYLGTEIEKHMRQGSLVPDAVTLQLLKKTMVKHQDTNRFLLDGFPRSVEQAKRFEQEIAEIAFGVYFEVSAEVMRKRIDGRAVKAPGRVDDKPEIVEKRIDIYNKQTMPVVEYYTPIGKIRKIEGEKKVAEKMEEKSVEEVYMEVKRFFSCRFLYLLGPPGAPITAVAERLEEKYGYSSIDLTSLLKAYAETGEKDAAKVKQALAKGRAVDASIACPLILSEIYRDMALGVQNFVICDFPQSSKQMEFLEYRVPSVSKTLYMHFSKADAEDLSSFSTGGGDALEVEVKIATLFGDEMQGMLKNLGSSLVRVPCSLAGLESGEQLVEAAWTGVREKVMPGLTIVLGLPCSGTETLAEMLAKMTPNTYVVDCDQLLDKELERRTEIGLAMHNMLARGQVVPLSMTLELLKNIVNLTCSDSLVIQNCPMYVDQVEYITKEFRIDRVFYIRGNDKAVESWRTTYLERCKGEDPSRETKAFNEHLERLELIVTHFSRLGKLEQLDVSETPKRSTLTKKIEEATMPQFALVSSVSSKLSKEQADLMAATYGVEPALTVDGVVKWANDKLKRTVNPGEPGEVISAFKQYADSRSFPLLVLDGYPANANDAGAFIGYLKEKGQDPRVAINIVMDEDARMEEYKVQHEDEDLPEEEELVAMLATERTEQKATFEFFQGNCPTIEVTWNAEATNFQEELLAMTRKRLLPRVYVLVAPSGQGDFSSLIANAVCTSRRDGGRAVKFTIIDSETLFKSGGHSADIEDQLHKASFTAEAPDCVPAPLWVSLFSEAMSQSANPMGTFLVTNFPTPCSVTSMPTIRDQFSMLSSISTLMGVVHVKLSEASYSVCVGDGNFKSYYDFEESVANSTLVQLGAAQICTCSVDSAPNADEAARSVAADFLVFQEKAEQARR